MAQPALVHCGYPAACLQHMLPQRLVRPPFRRQEGTLTRSVCSDADVVRRACKVHVGSHDRRYRPPNRRTARRIRQLLRQRATVPIRRATSMRAGRHQPKTQPSPMPRMQPRWQRTSHGAGPSHPALLSQMLPLFLRRCSALAMQLHSAAPAPPPSLRPKRDLPPSRRILRALHLRPAFDTAS